MSQPPASVSGAPSEYDEDLDGAPMDDLDGVALNEPINYATPPAAPASYYPPLPVPPPAIAFSSSLPLDSTSSSSSQLPFIPQVSASKVALFDAGSTVAKKALTPFEKKRLEAEEKRQKAEEEAAQEYARFVKSFETTSQTAAASAGTGAKSGGRGPPPRSSLLVHKAFVSGGIIGGGDPITAPTKPSVPEGAKPVDPATLKSSLPSTNAGTTKPLPFLPIPKATPFQSASNAASPATHPAAPPASSPVAPFTLSDDPPESLESASKKRKAGKPARAIDAFLEELKQKQEDVASGKIAPERPDTIGLGISHHPNATNDPHTTNIFVGNLSPELDEKDLIQQFAVYGDIASVKIMWPRQADLASDDGRKPTHQGFVSFMRREDAELALKEMHQRVLLGHMLKLNWSRAIPIPSQPLVYKTVSKESRIKLNYARSGREVEPSNDTFVLPPDALKYEIAFPTDRTLKEQIDLFASYVKRYGLVFEQSMLSRATTDPSFSFLTHTSSPEHLYYRWRLYSFGQGDSVDSWRIKPFQIIEGGPYWIPPNPKDWRALIEAERRQREFEREKQRLEERQEKERERRGSNRLENGKSNNWDKNDLNGIKGERGKLSEPAQKRLTELLRGVTMEKTQIRDVMGFCLDHSDASKDIVDIIAESLMLDETPIPKKIARLFVVSDLLHNSSAPIPNASSYRTLFQSQLPAIFAALHRTYHPLGRMSGQAMREKVMLVISAWGRWAIFTPNLMQQLEFIFHKGDPNQAGQVDTNITSSTPNNKPTNITTDPIPMTL